MKDGYNWVRINIGEGQYVESEGHYLTFQERNRKTLARMTIGDAIDLLPADSFTRVHQSFIVALNRIEKIERHQLTIGRTQVPLASVYRDEPVK